MEPVFARPRGAWLPRWPLSGMFFARQRVLAGGSCVCSAHGVSPHPLHEARDNLAVGALDCVVFSLYSAEHGLQGRS